MKKSLTLRYILHQMAYWSVVAAIISFASAYLLEKGFPASQVGLLLAGGNLLSCVLQPVLADRADRAGGNILKTFALSLTAVSMVCFGVIAFFDLPGWLFGLTYLVGVFTFDAIVPLMNAISVAYTGAGYRVNYGVGRGLGAFAFSLAALGIGKAMAGWGADWMIYIALGLLGVNLLVVLSYPNLKKSAAAGVKEQTCCSVPVFFRRYKWYCLSLLGVMFLAMFHAMTENYLIEIVTPLGGDSGTVGVALFIATVTELVVLLRFDWIRKHISDRNMLKLSGVFFLLKAVLLLLASSVKAIYAIHLLQAVTYCFLSPTQLYYAGDRVSPADMVKGQAFITAAYALGCAIGNFAGGAFLELSGVRLLLIGGIGMAAVGTVILFLTTERRDEG